ncbi:class I SAM-dependent methyltransferase [Gloeobacter morelensis]|uniref:Class I SAM-dependent methyltransferase n=1 Tax=Gloeobacter morelensis MG652769 TaxID=2781736 RepID=A0ABY3PQA5_9CYAN|nr:class I SAM-dependent methyltransferase [Gloeobacter morelensis]UFP95882.1 class I SAM-dependent methyltransferase [Gloeobacter morelensis MG652769]
MAEETIERTDYDDDLLARLYDAEYDAFDSDVAYYTERLAPGPVLELACGSGRLAVRLAADGRRVVGIDRSEAMIRRARTRRTHNVCWKVGDMRNFALEEAFANIVVAFSALGFLQSEADRRACLVCCRHHLRADGLLVLDLINPAAALATGELPGERTVVDPQTGAVFHKSTAVAAEAEQIRIRYTWRSQAVTLVQRLTLQRLGASRVEAELEGCGFYLLDRHGDYRANPPTDRAPRLILLAAPFA